MTTARRGARGSSAKLFEEVRRIGERLGGLDLPVAELVDPDDRGLEVAALLGPPAGLGDDHHMVVVGAKDLDRRRLELREVLRQRAQERLHALRADVGATPWQRLRRMDFTLGGEDG